MLYYLSSDCSGRNLFGLFLFDRTFTACFGAFGDGKFCGRGVQSESIKTLNMVKLRADLDLDT